MLLAEDYNNVKKICLFVSLTVFYIANLSNTVNPFYFDTMKCILVIFTLIFVGCAYNENTHPIPLLDAVKLPNAQQMAKNGRDDHTSQITRMPDPPPTESEEAPKPVNVRVQNLNEPLPIDDGLDFDKVER